MRGIPHRPACQDSDCPGPVGEGTVHRFDIQPAGIVRFVGAHNPGDPFRHFDVIRAGRVGEDIQNLPVPRQASRIFEPAAAISRAGGSVSFRGRRVTTSSR
ncbi:hypothetical protein [Arthrobacter methylotrophus]|uniref:hypothetical protein n=1 Tax=Arthrobacter methylotrophus TaxID=121291 RepID=UPI0031E522B3